MADLSQITLLPVAQVQGPQAVAQGSNSSSGALLANIPAGTTLQGFIVNRDGLGNPIVRTDKGDIAFTSQFFLKIGSEVVIRVGNSAGNPIANLITVDGQSPDVAQKTSAFAQDPEVILSPNLQGSLKSQAANATTANPPAQSFTVKGTVVAPPQQPNPALPTLPTGSNVALKVLSLDTPTTTPTGTQAPATLASPASPATTAAQVTSSFYATYARAAAAGNAPPSAPLSVTVAPASPGNNASSTPQQPLATAVTLLPQPATPTAAPVTTPTTPVTSQTASGLPPLPAGAALPVEAAAALPPAIGGAVALSEQPGGELKPLPGQPTAQPLTPLPTTPTSGGILTATVINHEVSGEPILHSPLGLIRLAAENPLPDGSHISFELETSPAQLPLLASAVSPGIPAPLPELAQHWNSLQQIFALLTGRSTLTELDSLLTPQSEPASQQALQPRLPDGKQISLAFLTFLTALKRNDFNNWLGYSNIRQLRAQGSEELLNKAQGEFASLSTQYTQSAPDQWQPIFFPIAVEGLVQQVRMYIKKDRKQGSENEGKKEEDTRFVIEVDLSALGEIQMDGFVRKENTDLQFDIVIRSLIGFTPEMQQDILKIYNDMGEITGYKGSLSFQSVREFPVNPMEDLLSDNDDVMA